MHPHRFIGARTEIQLIFKREGKVYLRCEVTLMANPEMDILVLLCAAHCTA